MRTLEGQERAAAQRARGFAQSRSLAGQRASVEAAKATVRNTDTIVGSLITNAVAPMVLAKPKDDNKREER